MISSRQTAQDCARAALLGFFPTLEAFENFKANDLKFAPNSLSRLVDFAEKHELVSTSKEFDHVGKRDAAFFEFLEKYCQKSASGIEPPESFTFSDFLQYEIVKHTGIKRVRDLIEQLSEVAQRLDMETPQASMVSRLKNDYVLNTPHKRNLIRLLSFWLGEKAPLSGWNFETLSKLPRTKFQDETREETEKEGVRIYLFAEGSEDVGWIKRELKSCIVDLNLPLINTHRINSFERVVSLDMPKENGESGEPRLYSKAIQNAISIAHQIYARWFLLYARQGRNLVIFINAGGFENLNSFAYTSAISVPFNFSAIIISDFAKMCTRLADIKVIFGKNPEKLSFYGNTLTIWSIKGFWYNYFDYIPYLLREEFLPKSESTYAIFKNALFFPENQARCTNKALYAVNRNPQNAILLLEIAKVCMNRRMFHEANEILCKIIAANPLDVVARTFRIRLLINLAMVYDKYDISKLYFEQAVSEAMFIEKNCSIEDEEFYCELGLMYLSMALRVFCLIRTKSEPLGSEYVYTLIGESEVLFKKGATFSPSGKGHRSVFWLAHAIGARKILKSNPAYFEGVHPFVDTHNSYDSLAEEIYLYLGFIYNNKYSTNFSEEDFHFFVGRLMSALESYRNSVDLKSEIPSVIYSFATAAFDIMFHFYPKSFVLKYVLSLLIDSKATTNVLNNDTDSTYSIICPFIQFQKKSSYLKCVDDAISAIQDALTKNNINLELMDDYADIDRNIFGGLKLMYLNMDYREDPHMLLENN